MKKSKRPVLVFFALLCVLLLTSKNAYAYIDPGSGSYMLQLLIAGLVGLSFTIKSFWKNIRMYFSARFGKKEKQKQEQEKSNG